MQPDHYTAKKHLQELRKSEFEAFIDEFLFSDAEKEILHKIYVEKLPLWKVGECCGYSESGGRWEANGSYDSRNSYANRRGSNYVRGYYRGGTMHSGHHDNMSYSDGKTMMIEQLEEMLNNADEKQQTAIRRCLEEIDRY